MRPTKTQLRQEIRARFRAGLDGVREKSEAICRWIAQDSAWVAARTVGIFSPIRGEPLLAGLWERAGDRVICCPRIRGEEMDFCVVSQAGDLEESVFGLREPKRGAAVVKPGQLDLVLVPGMAFTRTGARLGRGGGFYDRFLGGSGLQAVRLGVCFEWQIREDLPEEPHDLRVDRVVTELG